MHTKISHLGQKTYANNKNAGIFGLLKYYTTFALAKKKSNASLAQLARARDL